MFRALLYIAVAFAAEPLLAQDAPQVGDATLIEMRYETQATDTGGGSSSTGGTYRYVERVLDVSDRGVELEYAYPEDVGEVPLADWHMPVQVLHRQDGELAIVNRQEMEARRDRFLQEAGISVEACGSWYFTWNPFQVECDPDSVLPTIEYLHIQPEVLAEGAAYEHESAARSGLLSMVAGDEDQVSYRAQMPLDPEAIRLERAQGDVVTGEIMREPVTLEEALAARAGDAIEGTVTVTFIADRAGQVHTRIEEHEVSYTDSGGVVEHMKAQRTTTREPL